jgi:hypothetical protein
MLHLHFEILSLKGAAPHGINFRCQNSLNQPLIILFENDLGKGQVVEGNGEPFLSHTEEDFGLQTWRKVLWQQNP